MRGSFTNSADYAKLRQRLEEIANEVGAGDNRIFYFAIPPTFIETCASKLNSAGMISRNERPFTRVVVEQPDFAVHDYSQRERNQLIASRGISRKTRSSASTHYLRAGRRWKI